MRSRWFSFDVSLIPTSKLGQFNSVFNEHEGSHLARVEDLFSIAACNKTKRKVTHDRPFPTSLFFALNIMSRRIYA